MQLAIDVVIFAAAFAIVAKLIQQCRKPINQFVKRLRFVTDGFKAETPPSEWEKAALFHNKVDEPRPFSHAELLTRFVTY